MKTEQELEPFFQKQSEVDWAETAAEAAKMAPESDDFHGVVMLIFSPRNVCYPEWQKQLHFDTRMNCFDHKLSRQWSKAEPPECLLHRKARVSLNFPNYAFEVSDNLRRDIGRVGWCHSNSK